MPAATPHAGYLPYLIPLFVIGMVILRNSRARRLRIESLWISPVMIIVLIGLALSQQGMPTPLMIGLDLAALIVGAALGWWRGRLTHITINPETHELTSRASPVGMILILVIFAIRYGLRMMPADEASALHVSVNAITDASLVITVGLVCAQRLEVALRASRLLSEARSAKAP